MLTAAQEPSFLATRRGKLTLALLCGIAFLDFVDGSITNVALPSIRRSLNFSVDGLTWIPSGYLLTYGGFMLLGGRLADLLGRRRVLVTGIATIAVSSLVGGFAQSAGVLVGARLAQVLCAALTLPRALNYSTASARLRARPRTDRRMGQRSPDRRACRRSDRPRGLRGQRAPAARAARAVVDLPDQRARLLERDPARRVRGVLGAVLLRDAVHAERARLLRDPDGARVSATVRHRRRQRGNHVPADRPRRHPAGGRRRRAHRRRRPLLVVAHPGRGLIHARPPAWTAAGRARHRRPLRSRRHGGECRRPHRQGRTGRRPAQRVAMARRGARPRDLHRRVDE